MSCKVVHVADLQGLTRASFEGRRCGTASTQLRWSRSATSDRLYRQIADFRLVVPVAEAPIVVSATTGMPGETKCISDAGAQGYLCGSFEADKLAMALCRVLEPYGSSEAYARRTGFTGAQIVTRHTLAEGQSGAPRHLH